MGAFFFVCFALPTFVTLVPCLLTLASAGQTCNWTNYEANGRRFTEIIDRTPVEQLARLMQPFYALVLPVPLRLVLPAATGYCHKFRQYVSCLFCSFAV